MFAVFFLKRGWGGEGGCSVVLLVCCIDSGEVSRRL